MQINHNIRAMVTQHSLFQNNNAMTKSLEKLSTGLKINRAQDDAAGLAMSEQMRSQIRGFGKAKQNAQDGQAALQIAEGALSEITNMMQRQKELAVQAANDTLTSTERMYLNDEFQALTQEIDRIAKTTDYNGKNVLLFDLDPNKSFGATKLNPYDKEIAYLEGANVIYKIFGQYLNSGSLSTLAATTASLSGVNEVNSAIQQINTAVANHLNTYGIITVDNIKSLLESITAVSGTTVTGDIKLGGDRLWTGAANGSLASISGADLKILKEVNAFLKNAQDALIYFKASSKGEADARKGAAEALAQIQTLSYNDMSLAKLSSAGTSITAIDNLAHSLATAMNKSMASVAGVFNSSTAQKAYQQLMQIDTTKMPTGTNSINGTVGERLASLQKTISALYDLAKIYNEGATAVGTAASDRLHVTPNFSKGIGGSAVSEIKVNYTAIDVRGLGLQAQNIDSQRGATRAIDRLDDTIKIVSSNRAAIGTYINRLDYTVNNIASMEYNTQDAEGRIRDTDFSTETTNFTKNQIMVQSATSMLAQANSLPQSVLGLLG